MGRRRAANLPTSVKVWNVVERVVGTLKGKEDNVSGPFRISNKSYRRGAWIITFSCRIPMFHNVRMHVDGFGARKTAVHCTAGDRRISTVCNIVNNDRDGDITSKVIIIILPGVVLIRYPTRYAHYL
jgi:hypothetical protein